MPRPGDKRLVMYSDQKRGVSDGVDAELARLLTRDARIAFVPAQSDKRRRYFAAAEAHYAHLGFHGILHCDLDAEWDSSVVDEALRCDAIHLGSGDPVALVASIRRRGLVTRLREFAHRGVLIGVSAGAMALSKSVSLATYLEAVEREGAKRAAIPRTTEDLTGLGLVDFDFHPHHDEAPELEPALLRYRQVSKRGLVTCSDDGGVIVNGEAITLVGSAGWLGASRAP